MKFYLWHKVFFKATFDSKNLEFMTMELWN